MTGFLRCYACRYAMEGTKDRFGARWYRCGGQHSAGRCPERARVKADAIEAHVYYQVIELAGDVLYRAEAKLDGDRILELESELADVRDALQYLTADTPAMMKAVGKGRWTEQVTKLTEREETTLRMLGTARLRGSRNCLLVPTPNVCGIAGSNLGISTQCAQRWQS